LLKKYGDKGGKKRDRASSQGNVISMEEKNENMRIIVKSEPEGIRLTIIKTVCEQKRLK